MRIAIALPLVLLCLAGCHRRGADAPHGNALRTVAIIDTLNAPNGEIERDTVTGCEWIVFQKGDDLSSQPRMEVGPGGVRRQRCVTDAGKPAGQPAEYPRQNAAGDPVSPHGPIVPFSGSIPPADGEIPPPGPADSAAAAATPNAQDAALAQALSDQGGGNTGN